MTELTDRDLPGLTPQAARQAFEALAVRCGWDLAQAHGDGVTRWLDPMTRDLYLAWLEGHSSAMVDKDAEIAALREDAALGKIAMRFVDRAGDVHPGIDDAETICADFYVAMMKELEPVFASRLAAMAQRCSQ